MKDDINNELPIDPLAKALADLRRRISELKIATASYAAIGMTKSEYYIAVVNDIEAVSVKAQAKGVDRHQEVVSWLTDHAKKTNTKIVAAAILDGPDMDKLGERLWLGLDVVPYLLDDDGLINEDRVQKTAWAICHKFDALNLVRVPIGPRNEVGIAQLVTTEAYQKTVTPMVWKKFEKLVEEFKSGGNQLVFFNATPQGGGVALMRHSILRLLRLVNVDARWFVMQPNTDVFQITKTKFHNVLQGMAPEGIELNGHDKEVYEAWAKDNAEAFREIFKTAKVVVIDDPQPSGIVPYIQQQNPDTKIIYRSHIHMQRDKLADVTTAQYRTWQYIWNNIKEADLFISHPVAQFIPQEMWERTLTMPATTDLLDGLNKELDEIQKKYYISLFNQVLLEHGQTPLDSQRAYIAQIARFDPSKGISDVIDSYIKLCRMLDKKSMPQLVITGHGSVDDPDGIPIYNMLMKMLQTNEYRPWRDDIKIVRLHHNDQMLNTVLRGAKVALQLSYREGFEVKVSEALCKGVPVVAYRTGGIPLQINDGKNGFLVDIGETDVVADRLYRLFTDKKLYKEMSANAREQINPGVFTVWNAMRWLFLANSLHAGRKLPGKGQAVDDLISGLEVSEP